MDRIVCAFDDTSADAAVAAALRLSSPGTELLLLGVGRLPRWEGAGPMATRRIPVRGALSATLAGAAERAWRAGVSARTALSATADLQAEARLQAAAAGASALVIGERRGLLGRRPRVRVLRPAAARSPATA